MPGPKRKTIVDLMREKGLFDEVRDATVATLKEEGRLPKAKYHTYDPQEAERLSEQTGEPMVIAAERCVRFRGTSPEPGSVVMPCSRCWNSVWVCPTSQELVARKGVAVVCITCLSLDAHRTS